MAKITKKKAISIKGILSIDFDNKAVYVEVEDGEMLDLSDLLKDFDGCEVSASVSESIEVA